MKDGAGVMVEDNVRCKLTDADGYTHGGTLWAEGASYETSGEGGLCGPGWLHCYTDPLLAVLLNPIHANFINPRMCTVRVSGVGRDDHGLKEGWTKMAFESWVNVPSVTTEQRIRFGILCAMEVYTERSWVAWARGWLDGMDCTQVAAREAAARAAAAAQEAAAAQGAAAAARAAASRDAAARAAAAAWEAAAGADASFDLSILARRAMEASK